MATTQKLSKAQITTLGTISKWGGEMNTFAGQKGFYCLSVDALAKKGLIEKLGHCACCWPKSETEPTPCDREHTVLVGQKGGEHFYGRVRITDAGRAAYAEAVATPVEITPEIAEDLTRRINEAADKLAAEGTPVESVRREAVASIERQTVATGDKVVRGDVKGRVLEVCTRAGVMLAAVAFGFDLVWVKVAELVAL